MDWLRLRQVEVEAQPTRLILSSWILYFRVSTPYIIIPVTYNTYIAYIKANLIDLSDLVFILDNLDLCNLC